MVDGAVTRELRRRVLRPHLAASDPLPGDDLPDAVHFGYVENDVVLSTCFLLRAPCPWLADEEPSWHLRQMATEESRRGKGLGGAVVAAALDHVARTGGGIVWCNARERAVPMYRRAGFVGEGSIFTDEEHPIPHLRMWCRVPGRSAAGAG